MNFKFSRCFYSVLFFRYNEEKIKVLAIELKRQIVPPAHDPQSDDTEWVAKDSLKIKRKSNVKTTGEFHYEDSLPDSESEDEYDEEGVFSKIPAVLHHAMVSDENAAGPIANPKSWPPAQEITDKTFIGVPTYVNQNCCIYLHSKSESMFKILNFHDCCRVHVIVSFEKNKNFLTFHKVPTCLTSLRTLWSLNTQTRRSKPMIYTGKWVISVLLSITLIKNGTGPKYCDCWIETLLRYYYYYYYYFVIMEGIRCIPGRFDQAETLTFFFF